MEVASARVAREARMRFDVGHLDIAVIPELAIQTLEDAHVYGECTRGQGDGLEELDRPREEGSQRSLVDVLA